MFNVAVISLRDVGKAAIRILLLISVIAIAISVIKNSQSILNIKINYTFLQCLDICIPGIKQIEIPKENSITLSKILSTQLPLTDYFIEEETDMKNGTNERNETMVKKEEYSLNIPQNVRTEVIQTNVPESYTDIFENVNIRNGTDFELTQEMLSKEVEFKNSKNILIFHTHTCESYTPSNDFMYEMTGNYRTTDLDFTVARVGEELANYLENSGFNVIHDTTCYDYPSYDESYDRAYDSVSEQLKNSPDTEILFDIHRDAIADSSYAPTVKIGEEYAAQLMFVIGSNGAGQDHPNWLQNLNFAKMIQQHANEKYPGLFKPILFRNSRYNQNLGKGACIIEVGATGNTLEQCNTSMKYLADVLRDIL